MDYFIHEFVHLASDPAHLAFEVATTIVIEGILLGLLWPLVKRHIHRDIRVEHAKIEDEHGLVHPMSFAEASRIERAGWERQQAASGPYDYERSGE